MNCLSCKHVHCHPQFRCARERRQDTRIREPSMLIQDALLKSRHSYRRDGHTEIVCPHQFRHHASNLQSSRLLQTFCGDNSPLGVSHTRSCVLTDPIGKDDRPSRSLSASSSSSRTFHDRSPQILAAPNRYIQPTKTCAVRYPDEETSWRAIPSANVIGSTRGRQIMPKASGNLCMPTMSAVTGTTVAHKVPVTVPLARAKTVSTAYDLAGTQIARQKIPQSAVVKIATLMRPIRSDQYPIGGRPTASPKFSIVPTTEPWCAVSPMEKA
jgi:hypothetical protein